MSKSEGGRVGKIAPPCPAVQARRGVLRTDYPSTTLTVTELSSPIF